MKKIKPFGFGKRNYISGSSKYNYPENSQNEELLKIYFKEICQYKLLSKEEEKDLFEKYQKGNIKAKEKIIKSNLRLVVSIAGNFHNKGMSLLDLIGEGNVGLIKAVDHFRKEEGCKFSTYAAWWVYQSIARALIDTGKPIRIPNYIISDVVQAKIGIDKIKQSKGYVLDIETCLEELGYNKDRIQIIKHALESEKHIVQINSFGSEDGKLDLEDKKATSPGELAAKNSELLNLESKLKKLNERDVKILKMRFGLNGYKLMTLEEIGNKVNLSRERVRQIEKESLEKLNYLLAH